MSMKAKIAGFLGAGAVTLLAILFGLTTNASADCIYQYNANGFNTSSTPVFNEICGVPSIGDESNFVRIRPDVNGNDEDNINNPAYSIGTINSACTSGDKFDVWNYVHNNASQNDNPDVGSGSAVAVGTYLNMSAPLGTTASSFSFTATVGDTGNLTGTAGPTSTSNMTPAVIDCNGNQVKLSLVPGSVNIYSIPYGQWENLPQNAADLNTNLPIGSTNTGGLGSGDLWGCFNYRVVVVYQVEVTSITPPQTPPVCNSITANDQADIQSVSYTANSANVTGFSINLFGGTGTSGTPVASSGNIGLNSLPYKFNVSLSPGKQYTLVATVLSNLGNVTSNACQYTFNVPTSPTPPPTPTPTPPTTTTTTLINTGPSTGAMIGIFVAVSVAGTVLYKWVIRRRLAKN